MQTSMHTCMCAWVLYDHAYAVSVFMCVRVFGCALLCVCACVCTHISVCVCVMHSGGEG